MDPLQPNRRILIVDDNEAIHLDLRKVLSPAQANEFLVADEAILFGETAGPTVTFELDSAFQGQEALEKVRKAQAEDRPFAMAFVDIRMPPGWDGVETISHLWEAAPDLQVVICTAFSDYSWDQMVSRLGCSENLIILKKPFDNIEVLQLAHSLTRKWLVTLQAKLRMHDLDQLVARRTAELHEAHERLRQAQKMEAVGQLAGGVAHHFNNLHTVILGNLGLCEELTQVPELRSLLKAAMGASQSAASLTRALLSFSRQQVLRPRPVQLNEVISKLRSRLVRALGQNALLELDLAQNLPCVQADPDSLTWILQQLIHNAHDAMPQGGKCTVRTGMAHGGIGPAGGVSAPKGTSHVWFSVADTGMGMPPQVLARIFEPFFSTKEIGQGSGLALASVYGIVHQLDGCIDVQSRPGEGSTFQIRLPAASTEVPGPEPVTWQQGSQ